MSDIHTRNFNNPLNKPFHEMVAEKARSQQLINSPFMIHVRSDQEGLLRAQGEQGYAFTTYSPDGQAILHFHTRPPVLRMVEYLSISGFMATNCELLTDVEKLAIMTRNDRLAEKT